MTTPPMSGDTRGVEPERLAAMIAEERFLLEALTEAYEAGKLSHRQFSPAWDIGAYRIQAMLHVQASTGETQ